jgi:hypothetical protein
MDMHTRSWTKLTALLQVLMNEMGLEAPSWFAGTSACIERRSGLVLTRSVLSFGLRPCFGPFCHMDARLGGTAGFIAIPHERCGTEPPSLFVGTLAMYTEEVLIVSNSVGPFDWVNNVVHFAHGGCMAGQRNSRLDCNSS